jgi:hypothetical protein
MPGVLLQDTPFKTITIKELHPSYGAEVIGADFSNMSEEQFQEIRAAMAKVLQLELTYMHPAVITNQLHSMAFSPFATLA